MPYQSPAPAELEKIISELRSAYKNTNVLRLSCITLLERVLSTSRMLPDKERKNVLLGALVFVLTDIAKEYAWFSPERSTLYKSISAKLNLTATNTLNDDERFVYLGRFCLHLEKQNETIKTSDLYWKLHSSLIDYVENDLLLLKKREADRLEALQTTQPTLDAIEIEIDKFCDAYLAEYNNRRFFKSESRVELVNFVKFIRLTCQENFPKEQALKSEDTYLRSCYIRLGLIMYVLLAINNEYKFFKPDGNRLFGKYNGSSLFKMCEQALNIHQLSDLTCDQKMAWLNVLNAYVFDISCQTEKYKDNPLFSKLEAQRNLLNHFCTHKSELHNQPGWAMWGVTTATSNLASLAAGQMISAAVIDTAGVGTLATAATVLGISTGPAGWLALGAGTIIMSQLMRATLPVVSGWGINYILGWFGDRTGEATRHLIRHVFAKNRPNDYYELVNHPRLSVEERESIQLFIETALELSNRVIFPKEKTEIRRLMLGVMEADNDVKFVAHSDLAPVFSARR